MAPADVIESGGTPLPRHSRRRQLVVPVVVALAAAAAGAGVALAFTREANASAVLVCNQPLPGRVLNVNLSWSVGADAVTMDFGDGRVISLEPDVQDNQRLADMIRHRYATPGSYDVNLTARRGGAVAQSQCTFTAAE